MKIMRSKVVALVVAFMMVFSLIAMPVNAAETATAATVVTNDDAAKFLAEKNLLQGDNGNLMLDKELTREEMMVIVSRLLGQEDEAKAYATEEMTFQDVPATSDYAPYIAWALDNGITQGYSEEKFGFKDALTAWQTEAFFVRALGYVDTTDEEMEAKADELGLTVGSNVEANKAIVRGDMALLMFNTIHAKTAEGTVLGEDLGVLVVKPALEMTVAAATVKTIKATFNTAVDTTKATFAVTKDSVKVNVSNVAWNEAKTEATLNMASNLTEGDYAVKVSGVEIATAEKVVTVKDEETGKIEFLSDKAVLSADGLTVSTYIKVSNQYGQDITEDASLSFTASKSTDVDSQDKHGKVVITGTYEKDDKITVTAIDSESGAFANAVLTVVDKAGADTVTVAKLYCDDEDAVVRANEDDPDSDVFYLLLTAKDQYGNEMPVDNNTDAENIVDTLLITSSNVSRVDLTDTAANHYAVAKKTVDDVDYLALPLEIGDQAGKASIRMISKTTGKSTVYEVNVLEKAEVDTVSLTAPEIAAVGEDIEFVVTATDKEGKAVTSASDMSDVDVSVSGIAGLTNNESAAAGDYSWKKDGNKLILSLHADIAAARNDVNKDASKKTESKNMILTLVTPTNKVTQKTVKVYETAVPTTVGKLVDAKTAVLKDYSTTLTATDDEDDNNVVVYDQYDRVYDYTDNNFFGTYELKFSVDDTTNVEISGGASATITADGGSVTLDGIEKGSETVKVAIAVKAGHVVVTDSELEFTSNVVELKDIKSYEVEELPTVLAYDGSNLTTALDAVLVDEDVVPDNNDDEVAAQIAEYTVDVKVFGVLSNGSKLELPTDLYSVVASLPNTQAGQGLVVNGNELTADTDVQVIPFDNGKESTTGKVTVTIGGAEGPVTVEKAVTVSKSAMVATTISVNDKNADAAITLDGDTVTIDKDDLTNASILLTVIEVKDQYGVVNPLVVPTSTIFSNITDDNKVALSPLTCVNSTGAITNDDDGDTFKVTFIYANGKSVSLNVNVID